MNSKDKKKYRKNKRKREKKYITQGKLPADYEELSQEKKEELYYAIRSEMSSALINTDDM